MRHDTLITILRIHRRTRYVIIDLRIVEDSRLSWAARGLLSYLLSRPDNWQVRVRDLQRRGDLGRDGIYKLLKELRDAGYARLEWRRDERGRICGGTHYIYEQPFIPYPDSPDTVGPDTAEPAPAKPEGLLKTDEDLKRTTTTTTHTTTNYNRHFHKSKPDGVEFPPWIPEEFKPSAEHLVKALNQPLAQLVIDEWAGLLEVGAIHSSPLGYLHTLVKRMQAGEFTPKYAEQVAARRYDEMRR